MHPTVAASPVDPLSHPAIAPVMAEIHAVVSPLLGRNLDALTLATAREVYLRVLRPYLEDVHDIVDVGTPESRARGIIDMTIIDRTTGEMIGFEDLLAMIARGPRR